jgi:transglutaminase-like putative cysteine protease
MPPAGQVVCALSFDVTSTTELLLQIAASGSDGAARFEATVAGRPVPVEEICDAWGNRLHLLRPWPGRLTVRYEATADVPAGDPQPAEPAPVRTDERIVALRPSRYCPSDRLLGYASGRYGHLQTPVERVRAICADVFERLTYAAQSSDTQTDAIDTLLSGRGVCRDYAHLVVALCRAVDVPARFVSVYAPGLSPMDFHAVVETALDGRWQVWDATRLAPRASLVRIANGRDAADTAIATVLSGAAQLVEMEVFAIASGDLPIDDHDGPATLGSVSSFGSIMPGSGHRTPSQPVHNHVERPEVGERS